MSNDNDHGDEPELDAQQATQAAMVAAGMDLERRFPGCWVTLFVIAPGAAVEVAKGEKPQYNHVTNCESPADQMAVLRDFIRENSH